MRPIRIPFFRIFYSTTYTILFAVLIILLAVSPGEIVYQCIKGKSLQEPIVIGGVYVVTATIAIFVYASRLYTSRSVLSAIPKTYVPIEPGEVGKSVRRMIVNALKRSQLIAWDSRPRDVRPEQQQQTGKKLPQHRPGTAERTLSGFKRKSHLQDSVIPVTPSAPPWGNVEHPGWSSPASDDLPDLQFSTVVSELPNLIEAKAVSLAPSDMDTGSISGGNIGDSPFPDPRVVAVLQRSAAMDLRGYLSHLSELGLIEPPTLGARFLALYEYARFSSESLTEREFRRLMDLFTEILTCMSNVDSQIILDLQFKLSAEPELNITFPDAGSPNGSVRAPATPSSASSRKDGSDQESVRYTRTRRSASPRERSPKSIGRQDQQSEASSIFSTGSVVIHSPAIDNESPIP
ncbi:MAG: hypothetical protein Q9165_000560 [Trypethelium subeluteriae]